MIWIYWNTWNRSNKKRCILKMLFFPSYPLFILDKLAQRHLACSLVWGDFFFISSCVTFLLSPYHFFSVLWIFKNWLSSFLSSVTDVPFYRKRCDLMLNSPQNSLSLTCLSSTFPDAFSINRTNCRNEICFFCTEFYHVLAPVGLEI